MPGAAQPATMTDRRDVVLVTVDSLRADVCGYDDGDRDTTPTLDALAAEGLVFENAIAPAVATRGSACSFFTGQYPIARPTEETRAERIRSHVRSRETLPERFSRLGYETAGITANPWTSRYFAFDDGFDRFEDFMNSDATSDIKRGDAGGGALTGLAEQILNWWQGQDMYMSWEAIYADIRAALEAAESPHFLWIFLVDAHMPYLPGPGHRSQSRLTTYLANAWLYSDEVTLFESTARDVLLTAYADTVRYTDEFLRRLTADIDALEADPLVVFHADHGEEFGEYGRYGHGASLREAAIRVPLVVANGPQGRVRRPFSLYDMPELVVSLATGADYEHLLGSYALSRNFDPMRAVRGDGWKYVASPGGERLLGIEGGEEFTLENDRLRAIGRDILDRWEETDAERRRIIRAVDDVPAGPL
jgi:arylsulfatase